MNKGLKIFITYAHKNSEAKDDLIISLAVLKQNGLIDVWHDNEILPGDKWRDEIFNNLADSDILLYLTCRYSLASENCNKELTAALNPNIRVIPIILEHCDWQNHQLSNFQALPDKGKPINEWQPESKGWQNVIEGIRKVVTKIQVQAKPSPHITPEEMETLSNVKLQRGNFLMMLKQMDQAIAAYSRAIELNPELADAYNGRGAAYGSKREHDRAIEDYTKAIELDPEDAIAYYNRGISYDEKGDVDRTIANYTKAIKLDPELADAYSNRGNAYREKGELESAIKDFNKAIDLDSKHASAYNNRGIAYYEKGEHDLAIKDYTTAIKYQPHHVDAYNNRGIAYYKKGEHDLAIKDYTTAIEHQPNHADAYSNRGNAYAQKGEHDLAIKDYTTAIKYQPNHASAYNNRGAAYVSKGEFNAAIVNFTKAIKLDPDYTEACINCGMTWLYLRRWENFRSDLSAARDVGIDIAIGFRNVYGSVANFERRTGIQLPEDIAAMLTPRQK